MPPFLIIPLLNRLQSADATTWFKNLYERSDVIKATPKANQSVALYEKQAFRDLDCPRLQSHFRSHHIIVTDQSYLAPKFDKAALVDILKSESKPFRFIGMFTFLTFGNAVTP